MSAAAASRCWPLFTLSDRRCYDAARAHALKVELPYGMWGCRDNRLVLFNRYYEPLLSKRPGRPAVVADPDEWVRSITQLWFYDNASAPWRSRDTEHNLRVILAMFRRG